jgi:hypothetical protein
VTTFSPGSPPVERYHAEYGGCLADADEPWRAAFAQARSTVIAPPRMAEAQARTAASRSLMNILSNSLSKLIGQGSMFLSSPLRYVSSAARVKVHFDATNVGQERRPAHSLTFIPDKADADPA